MACTSAGIYNGQMTLPEGTQVSNCMNANVLYINGKTWDDGCTECGKYIFALKLENGDRAFPDLTIKPHCEEGMTALLKFINLGEL